MPNSPIKVRVVRWCNGDDGQEWDVYTQAPDGLYYSAYGNALSREPLERQPDGTYKTTLGTVVCSATRKAPVPGTARDGADALGSTAFKADTDKSRWTLLLDCAKGCGRAVRAVVRVLNFAVRPVAEGGKGYVPHSWRQVPNARTRYEDALHRHLDAIRDGETHDVESGESHWAHVATNALFLWELDNPKENTDE